MDMKHNLNKCKGKRYAKYVREDSFEEGVWTKGLEKSEPRMNGLYKTRHLVTDIKRIGLEWLGHVIT
jgi:hypothetical protein